MKELRLSDKSGERSTELLAEGSVRIWLCSAEVISARVRDSAGIVDVGWSRALGWSCTCGQAGGCEHRAAVELITATTADGASTFASRHESQP